LNEDEEDVMSTPSVLMMGYNGANNTGAEALLLADIEDVRAVLGPNARITVPTINPANLRRYLHETPTLHIAPIPTLYFLALRQLVRQSDLVMLVEGSTYMDTWTSAMLWAYLWVTHSADSACKPCLAYAVDAGTLKRFNRWLTRREASKTDLIIARAAAAAERLRSWGVTAPIETTADNAFTFAPDPADAGLLRRLWPEATGPVAGMCLVNIHLWPVVMRPWGRPEHCYRWPYYYSHSPERSQAAEGLAQRYAAVADWLVAEHSLPVALICMEQLDEPFARQVQRHMTRADRARVFSAKDYNASQMSALLRDLNLLITARYHAAILSLAAQVPQIAVGHDLRLKSLYGELGLQKDLFLDPQAPNMVQDLETRLSWLRSNTPLVKAVLQHGYDDHLASAKRNRDLLRTFVASRGWEVAA
jgi:polysaccharide pyruvyl transferase WcaK-like protein